MWVLDWVGNVGLGLKWRCTYLGDIVVVAFDILEAEFLGGTDIPVCGLVWHN